MLLELKNLFLEDGGKKDLHYEMDLSQVVFSGVRPFITPVSVTAQAENRAGAIHLKADVAFDFRCPCDRCAAETQRAYRFSFQHVLDVYKRQAWNSPFCVPALARPAQARWIINFITT